MTLNHRTLLGLLLTIGLVACGDDDSGSHGHGTEAASTGSDETGDSNASETTGELPEQCDAPDPAADASFDLALGDWGIDTENLRFDVDARCTVGSVTAAGGAITTALQCADGDESHDVTLELADAESGAATWSEGDTVDLFATGTNAIGGALPDGVFGQYVALGFSLHADDGSLLAAGSKYSSPGALLMPLAFAVTDSAACGIVMGCSADMDRPLAFTVSESGGEALELLGGQRGALPLSDGSVLHIDAPVAHASSDCHASSHFHVLVRRLDG